LTETLEVESGRIRIRSQNGDVTLDTEKDTLHTTGFLSGSTVLPALAAPDYPALGPFPSADHEVALGSSNGATVLFGNWRLTDAEGLAVGEIAFVRDEEINATGQFATKRFRRRHLYAPRLPRDEWFSIGGGPSVLDMYWFNFSVNPYTITTQGTLVPEIGRLWHTLQFVIDGGNVKLIRRGVNVAHEYAYLYYPPGSISTEAWEYNYCFDCAALTIEYQIRLGRFT